MVDCVRNETCTCSALRNAAVNDAQMAASVYIVPVCFIDRELNVPSAQPPAIRHGLGEAMLRSIATSFSCCAAARHSIKRVRILCVIELELSRASSSKVSSPIVNREKTSLECEVVWGR